MINQRTILKPVSMTGIGLHSGAKVEVAFRPAPADTGIVYTRTDLNPNVTMKCTADNVKDTQLCTALVNESGVRISTVEHLTAALSALGIDNLFIDVNAPEIPVMDGSAQPFIYLFASVGIQELSSPKKFLRVVRKVRVENEGKWAELTPSESGFNLDLQIDFNHPAMDKDKQHYAMSFTGEAFARDVSRARTFCFMRDVEYMHAHNLALGGSLENAVVLDDHRVINPEGLRYEDEFVKHKLLDAIGDLYMDGHSILANFKAYKTGHDLNNRLLRALLSDSSNYEVIQFADTQKSKSNVINFLDTKKTLTAF
ncbi:MULTISPECIES: UDP-3-O-acyl-N-acetylglucosamine deacetylase [Succinivibrio]|uniref:UDP-3-O-acyl-N-acetylglucosamine deacetylase n=1 Tax=Succinivibrio dextrinosolvens TaxID=83771 RepID=A0A662ZCQ8_9GAMM|nr:MULTISPECIES: UDP-3-O-acyl-N-acetylglucosamine deacetylase [Succinivibrio]MBQ9221147.1 UDP-3-O-acyl-N-acetylglucosamine deacetylase [Succinivibrio sp.]MDY6415912.1 UDP-3-O-acyl-N-acetylglucosamine deacetylase [Succinivibrio dextrinosolvens]MDY6421031.1 UDP-3-O-acyl-N-acetylglucosamine deacetylase [Succinivibrio dextrinosolvens]SFK33457.1 UDP-3-O-[3-hydroxymyristoyl] N-acetylglucosamine deacetylase [Succinivibrio dextrinosolvens]